MVKNTPFAPTENDCASGSRAQIFAPSCLSALTIWLPDCSVKFPPAVLWISIPSCLAVSDRFLGSPTLAAASPNLSLAAWA